MSGSARGVSDLSTKELSTIEAVVEGVQKRAQKKRKRSRQGWAFLITGALSIPIFSAAFNGAITTSTAASRIGIALFITSGISAMVGSLFDSYQGQAAVKSVQEAVVEAKKKAAEEAEEQALADQEAAAAVAAGGGRPVDEGDDDGDAPEASDNGADDEG
ncbi:MAG: hypothetical protein AAGC53_02740 [Actinomycetota bacterium]